VVGVNGSGKTQLLQTLSEIFLSLERKKLPPFRVTFAYDLEKIGEEERPATIYLRYPQDIPSSAAIFAIFEPPLRDEQDWEELENTPTENFDTDSRISLLIRGDQLGSSIRPYLPKVLLAYTSGATETWATLFANQQTERENLPDAVFEEITPEEERLPDWDLGQEKPYREKEGLEPLLEPELTFDGIQTDSIGYYVSPQALKLVFFAVSLHQARKDFQEMPTEQAEQAYRDRIEQTIQNHEPMSGLRGLFNKIDWLWLISVNFQILFQPTRFSQQTSALTRLYPLPLRSSANPFRAIVGNSSLTCVAPCQIKPMAIPALARPSSEQSATNSILRSMKSPPLISSNNCCPGKNKAGSKT
jgi:hypothetical protein